MIEIPLVIAAYLRGLAIIGGVALIWPWRRFPLLALSGLVLAGGLSAYEPGPDWRQIVVLAGVVGLEVGAAVLAARLIRVQRVVDAARLRYFHLQGLARRVDEVARGAPLVEEELPSQRR